MRTSTTLGAICALLVIPIALMLTGGSPRPQDPKVQAHALARFEAIEQLYAHLDELRKAGTFTHMAIEDEVKWSLRFVEAAVAAGKMTATQALERHVGRVQGRVRYLQELHEAGRVSFPELSKARYHLADAQLRLAAARKD